MFTILSIVFVFVCIFLVFAIIIQPSQGEGLASAFGGGGSETFFGTKAGQHINRFTIILSIIFLLLAIFINKVNKGEHKGRGSIMEGTSIPAGQPPAPPPPDSQPPTPPNTGTGQ